MKKKLFASLLGALALTASFADCGFAAAKMTEYQPVREEHRNIHGDMTRVYIYPRFVFDDKAVEEKINAFFEAEGKAVIARDYADKNLVRSKLDFSIAPNPQKYLSVFLDDYTFRTGEPGYTQRTYYVFNLETGERMHYTDFVPRITSNELYFGLKNGIIEAYSAATGYDTKTPLVNENIRVSENFFPNAAGVELVYEPNELDDFQMGRINVKLTKEAVWQTKEARRIGIAELPQPADLEGAWILSEVHRADKGNEPILGSLGYATITNDGGVQKLSLNVRGEHWKKINMHVLGLDKSSLKMNKGTLLRESYNRSWYFDAGSHPWFLNVRGTLDAKNMLTLYFGNGNVYDYKLIFYKSDYSHVAYVKQEMAHFN